MADFEVPNDISFNRAPISDADAFAHDANAASWLFLCGEEFAAAGGLAYSAVEAAVPVSENIISDPPRTFTLDLLGQHLEAMDRLPRPLLVTCRAGPRSSASVYVYAGLKAGASADEVLARADADEAPFTSSDEYRALVVQGIERFGSPPSDRA